MKLSDVKTDEDFERYEAGKIAQTYEQLQAEMGIGPRAWSLPAPHNYSPSEDGFYAHERYLEDHKY